MLASPTTHKEEMLFIQEAFDKNWIAPLGFNCDRFEEEISKYLCKDSEEKYYALSLCSGTSALHLAYKLAGVIRGDVVLCSVMTFSATVNPVSYEGGIQVFIDCEEETWNMDPDALEQAFEKYPKAKVVALTHLYGTPAKLDEIISICKRYNATLIEDSAESLSATYKGKQTGTFGKYNAISFNGNKIITTSGGGALLTVDKASRDKAFFWATQAREKTPWYEHEEIGYNYRLSNVLAGIGRGQLIHLEEHRKKKEEIYFRYKEAFQGLPVQMNPYLRYTRPNFWLSCILIEEKAKIKPLDILELLAKQGIETRPLWKPMHMQPVFKGYDCISTKETPVGESLFARGLCLPSDIKMTKAQQDYVIESVKRIFQNG